MPGDVVPPTERELEILKVLWDRGEGSVRDSLSLLDQSVVLGGGTVSIETVRMLVGAPRTDLQFELADALAELTSGAERDHLG